MNDNNSGVNTILIVIVLLLIVGFGVWYFKGGMMSAPAEDNAEFNLNVEVPSGNGGEGEQQ